MKKETLIERLRREIMMRNYIHQGYTRRIASKWCKRLIKDNEIYKEGKLFSKEEREKIHDKGFLCSTFEKYDIEPGEEDSYVSDFEYLYLKPFNNSFSKWLTERTFADKIFIEYKDVQRKIFFTIFSRDGGKIILPYGGAEREYSIEDIRMFLKEYGAALLLPTRFASGYGRFVVEYDEEGILVDRDLMSLDEFNEFLEGREETYCIAEIFKEKEIFSDGLNHLIKVWVANDTKEGTKILSAEIGKYYNIVKEPEDESFSLEKNFEKNLSEPTQAMKTKIKKAFEKQYIKNNLENAQGYDLVVDAAIIDSANGSFVMDGIKYNVPRWENIRETIIKMSESVKQLTYFSIHLVITEEELFKITRMRVNPVLPSVPYNEDIKEYLKSKFNKLRDKEEVSFSDRFNAIRRRLHNKRIAKTAKPGMRTYMQKLWNAAVRDDFRNTKGASMLQKIRAHKKGFLSFRIWQYGLTKDNYKEFLSDYDYHWLNRINNEYQKLINDKTTYRFTMEPFKAYIPKYYFSIFKRDDKVEMVPMRDCPGGITSDIEGLEKLLRLEGKLAFKASAGTHGDGFYCLAYKDGQFEINDEKVEMEDIKNLITSVNSFYIITEFLYMHKDIRKIYAKTVNTVRVMVINEHGYDPKIMQTYMRIGASKTGYTDNVGYGGICTKVNIDTGEIYQPETIKNHVFYPCPIHPDTGVEIKGYLPNWELVKKVVCDVSRYLGELEYLGFDVAITDEGLQILEINIHQDLHKVADFTDEIKEFYNRKIIEKTNKQRKIKEQIEEVNLAKC